jgi:hypothetical protein
MPCAMSRGVRSFASQISEPFVKFMVKILLLQLTALSYGELCNETIVGGSHGQSIKP